MFCEIFYGNTLISGENAVRNLTGGNSEGNGEVYLLLYNTPLLNQESSADSERTPGLPHPREFHRWRFLLWYRVKSRAKNLG